MMMTMFKLLNCCHGYSHYIFMASFDYEDIIIITDDDSKIMVCTHLLSLAFLSIRPRVWGIQLKSNSQTIISGDLMM